MLWPLLDIVVQRIAHSMQFLFTTGLQEDEQRLEEGTDWDIEDKVRHWPWKGQIVYHHTLHQLALCFSFLKLSTPSSANYCQSVTVLLLCFHYNVTILHDCTVYMIVQSWLILWCQKLILILSWIYFHKERFSSNLNVLQWMFQCPYVF